MNCSIEIKCKPASGKYSSGNSNVVGTANICFLKSNIPIANIYYGLRGTVFGVRYETKASSVAHELTYTQDKKLFDKRYSFLNGCQGEKNYNCDSSGNYLFTENDSLTLNFMINFPQNMILPSSFNKFGGNNDERATITILYEVYVCVFRYSKLLKYKKEEFYVCPICYQADSDSNFLNYPLANELVYFTKKKYFMNKGTNFTFDENQSKLIPSDKHNKKNSIIKNFFSKKSKCNENFNFSIPIVVLMKMKSHIDANKSLLSQLCTHFYFDLSKFKNGNKSHDFVFKNQSTGLGYFKINSLQVLIDYESEMNISNCTLFDNSSDILATFYGNEEHVIFDLKDLLYKEESHLCCFKIEPHMFFNNSQSILNLLHNRTIMLNCTLDDYFSNITTLSFVWMLSDYNSVCPIEVKTTATVEFFNNDELQ
ncbi:hypothetical protein DAMA08_043020 [Martiniozyma asiatica (nom. inval.)]|nr:hypothetical protein DAMA08_043020 [Martiniozyma asiatica]